jgi:hypothetical protein
MFLVSTACGSGRVTAMLETRPLPQAVLTFIVRLKLTYRAALVKFIASRTVVAAASCSTKTS